MQGQRPGRGSFTRIVRLPTQSIDGKTFEPGGKLGRCAAERNMRKLFAFRDGQFACYIRAILQDKCFQGSGILQGCDVTKCE